MLEPRAGLPRRLGLAQAIQMACANGLTTVCTEIHPDGRIILTQGLPIRLGLTASRRMTARAQMRCSTISVRVPSCWRSRAYAADRIRDLIQGQGAKIMHHRKLSRI